MAEISNVTSITYEQVRNDANIIKDCASKAKAIFNEFGNSMNRVGAEDVFVGNAAESLGTSYKRLSSRFESYVKLVEQFSNMILGAAQQTEMTEKQIAEAASQLPGNNG